MADWSRVADGALAAYYRMALAQARSQLQYRTSFAVDAVSSLLTGAVETVTVLVLFQVTPALGGFSRPEAFLIAALASLAFALADLIMGNVEQLRSHIRRGSLDALLVRPLSALGQLAVLDFAPRRIGRVVQGLLMAVAALTMAPVHWTATRVLLLVLTPLAGAVLFGSLFVATATASFWWIDAIEFANSFTYGGRDFTGYPITVYGSVFRRLFAFGLGFGFVAYYPALALLGRPDPLGLPTGLGWASPLVALVAAGVAGALWRWGIRHYRSTGS